MVGMNVWIQMNLGKHKAIAPSHHLTIIKERNGEISSILEKIDCGIS